LKKLDQIFDYEGRIQTDDRDNYRCGFVSLIGAPNMGKSTLLNALLKEDLCIATRRPQTTRHAILGILSGKGCQVCLVDTPGVIETPAYKLQEGMMEAVAGAFHSADGLLVVTDVFSTPIPDDALFQKLQKSRKPIIVVVNKVDLVNVVKDKHDPQKRSVGVEEAVAVWRQLLPSALAILPVTASAGPDDPGVIALRHILTGGPNVAAAMRNLGRPVPGMLPAGQTQYWTDEHIKAALLPLSPPLYDQDVLTDRTERFVASEMIRAALFETFRKELPYCCEVQVTGFNEPKESDLKKGKKQITRISADIIVERESQKIIVIGKKGEQIKNVGIKAREKLEDFLQSQVRCRGVYTDDVLTTQSRFANACPLYYRSI
jgi:GTP-binding protein Era